MGNIYDMAAAVKDATRKAAELRPNSQTSIVWVSDGIAPIFFEDRDATQQILIRDNVIFNSLTVELRTLFKFLMPDRKSTRLNSSHPSISYAVFCLKKKKNK